MTNAASVDKLNWELKQGYVAAYAVQGHRAHMEDRFVINDDINRTGVSLFAVFDGHGGQFAADYARDKLMPNINKKVIELKNILAGVTPEALTVEADKMDENESQNTVKEAKISAEGSERRKSFRKTVSTTDDCTKNKGITDPVLLDKLDSLVRPITREVINIFF